MVSENSFGKSFLTDSVRPLHRPFRTFSRGPFSLFLLYYLLRTIVTNDRERHKFLRTHPCSDTNGYIIARARNGKKRLIFDCSFFLFQMEHDHRLNRRHESTIRNVPNFVPTIRVRSSYTLSIIT